MVLVCNGSLTPCQKKSSQAFHLTLIEDICLWLGKGSGREACPDWVQGDNFLQAFVCANDKTDGTANEVVVEIKSAVPYTVDVVLVDKAPMNEIKSGNKHVVKVTTTHDIPPVQFMLPD
jgi:hypothetical protein